MATLDQALKLLITGDSSGLTTALGKATRETKSFGDAATRSFAGVKSAFAALGVTLSAGAFGASIKAAINSFDELGKASQRIGVSVEALSGLKYAAELSDVSFADLETSLKKFSKTLADSKNGSRQAAEALLKVGAVAGESVEENLLRVADAFAAMPDGIRKTALAVELFGKSGTRLIPFLNAGAAGIRDLMKEAERLGIVVSTDTAKAAERFNDSLTTLGNAAKGVGYSIANFLLTPLADAATAMKDASVETDGFWSAIKRLGKEASDSAWFGKGQQGLGNQLDYWEEQKRGALQMEEAYRRVRDGQEETFGQRATRGFRTVVEEMEKWRKVAGEAEQEISKLRGAQLQLALAEDKVSGSGKEVEEALKRQAALSDEAAAKVTKLKEQYKSLSESIGDSLEKMRSDKAVGPAGRKPVDQGTVLDINRLKDVAETLMARGDYKAALQAARQASEINDYLLENKKISETYYRTQAEQLQDEAGVEIATSIDGSGVEQEIPTYQQLWQQMLDQNPLRQPVVLQPQEGAWDANGNPLPLTPADIPQGITPGMAAGGRVAGPGTGTSDSVLARLSAGEYVVRAAAVRSYGASLLDRINSLAFPRFNAGGLVPAFAGGGSVGTPVHLHIGGESLPMSAAPDVAQTLQRIVRTEVLKRGRR